MRVSPQYWPKLLWSCVAVSSVAAVFHYWRLLKMHEAPISTIAAAAQGYVELYGRACTEIPLRTPYQGIPCVWYRAWVFANRQNPHHAKLVLENRLLDYVESQSVFTLDDGTAQCQVNPAGAEVVYYQARTWRKNDHRYVEEFLPTNQSIYVIGQLDTRHDVLSASALNKEVSARLKDLKSRPQHLLNLYDHNLNQEIDMDEWELARQDVIHQVKSEHAMRAHTGSFVLSKPADRHLFLISAKSPAQLRTQHKQWLLVYLVISAVLLALSLRQV
jgi:hypothetical protein